MAMIVDRRALTRREMFSVLAVPLVSARWAGARTVGQSALSEPNERVAFQWNVPSVYVDTVRQNLVYEGTETPETNTRGWSLLVVFAGTILILDLARTILELRRDIIYGGVVITTCGHVFKIDTDERLDAGMVVVIDCEKTTLYQRDQLAHPTELAEILKSANKH